MALNIHLKLTGDAERLVRELCAEGMTETDVMAKALWLLRYAHGGRLGVLINAPGASTGKPIVRISKLSLKSLAVAPLSKSDTDFEIGAQPTNY